MKTLNHRDIEDSVSALSLELEKDFPKNRLIQMYPVPRGGIPVAYLLYGWLDLSMIVDTPEEANVIIDDIIDSGDTKARYQNKYNKPFYALYERPKQWLIFPWEQSDGDTPITDNLVRVKQYILGDINDHNKKEVEDSLKELIKLCS